ncbi:hypothetical protein BDK51DRAFT_48738 [Blyttiomyces helicus]|uniref:Uncharacterized protein n=1 Tax=Blyttiomyces helicus TaxID=388810 RepID=A0A4P9W832_9FUNG|nr:hypothetical protein BDK51DRAFT_48738 [Blyttiomyces helicus]|eukprot:RKO87585.1 hypothetical protein BDK51DRAFT_48738 [Blyttiomyces helicus]
MRNSPSTRWPLFDGSSASYPFSTWKARTRLDLEREDLWYGVVVPNPDLESGNHDPSAPADWTTPYDPVNSPHSDLAPLLTPPAPSPSGWTTDRKQLTRAFGLMADTLAPSVFRQVETVDSPRALWARLADLFERSADPLLDAFAEQEGSSDDTLLSYTVTGLRNADAASGGGEVRVFRKFRGGKERVVRGWKAIVIIVAVSVIFGAGVVTVGRVVWGVLNWAFAR